jgi:hypothetical protein
MNPAPLHGGRRRSAREDCEIGDWVDADDVRDWSQSATSHGFQRAAISISPGGGDLGSFMLSSRPQRWNFVARHRGGRLVWVRDR